MPSPFGHLLAGVAVAWSADLVDRRPSSARFVATCGALAALPDADLIFPGHHRTWSHSITGVLIVTIIAAFVTGRVTRWRAGLVCGAAYLSHLVLDWLAADGWPPYGLQIFWPFSDRWFISGWDLFRQTSRDQLFTEAVIQQNVLAVAQELAMFLPVLVVLWLVRVKTLTGLSAEVPRGDHPPQ